MFVFMFFPSILYSQEISKDDAWAHFRPFVGSWTGTGGGVPGLGNYERTYEFIFNNTFISIRNKSVYTPSANHPEGEIHEDLGYISYDRNRKTFVMRQFHKEGFVNQYRLDSISPDGKTIVFVTESIENIPDGWRAKETYRLLSQNEIEESFELAGPDSEFEVYSKVLLIRR